MILRVRSGPQRAHGFDVLVVPGPAARPGHAQRFELFLEPANPQAEFHPASGNAIERGQFLGQYQRIALRHDKDAGTEPQCRRRRRSERQPDERVGNGRVRFRRDLAVFRVGVPGGNAVRQHHVLAAPHGLESGGLSAPADFPRVAPLDTDAAREGQPDFHGCSDPATELGTQLPWNPLGTRGSATDATGSSSMLAASRITN